MLGPNEKLIADIQSAELLKKALDTLTEHQFQEAESLAYKALLTDPQNGYAHMIRLLAAAKVTDPMELPDEILFDPKNELMKNAVTYGDEQLKNMLVAAKANSVTGKFLEQAQTEERAGNYDKAYDFYKAMGKFHNGQEKAKEMRYKQGEKAYAAGDYEKAVQYFKDAAGIADSHEKLQLAIQAQQVRKAFEKEVGNQHTYIEKRLQALCPAELKQYRNMEKTVNRGSWCHGVGYLIAAALMLLASVAMCLDVNANNSFIYVLFGVCWAFAIHKVFDWDFSFFKSCFIAFLCSAAPFALRFLSDSLFETETPAFYIAVLFSGIVFIRGLFRQIEYLRAKSMKKKKVQYKLTVLDPKINAIRKELAEKYSAKIDKHIAERWARSLTLH